jgi:hypothetical protein
VRAANVVAAAEGNVAVMKFMILAEELAKIMKFTRDFGTSRTVFNSRR